MYRLSVLGFYCNASDFSRTLLEPNVMLSSSVHGGCYPLSGNLQLVPLYIW